MSGRGKKREKANEELKEYLALITSHKVVLAVVVIVLVALIGGGVYIGVHKNNKNGAPSAEAVQETAEGTEENTEEAAETEVPDEPMEENAYPEVNELIASYYQAVADGDIEKIQQLKDGNEEKELIRIQKKSDYIENYNNLTCYTKKGPQEGSFVVYASYELKFKDMARLVPGMNALYVCRREDGSYYIYGQELDDDTYSYIETLSLQDDVRELNNRVQVAYNNAVTEDANIAAFLQKLSDEVIAAVGEELEARETAETQPDETVQAAVMPEGTKAKATDVVNVRKSDSESADKIGKVQIDEVVLLLEERANGWSKIEYEGGEGYIKSEYLTKIGGEEEPAVEEGGQSPEEQPAENPAENADTEQSGSSVSVPDSGKFRVSDTINVRKSASNTAEKIGVCYPGDTLEILMKQADGWTKVKFDGKTGYVKSSVLK